MTKFLILMVALVAVGSPGWVFSAEIKPLYLNQSKAALLADQRLVGNVRAQAKREGVVVAAPQLYVYFSDFSPAFHIDGYRPTLIEELEAVIQGQRRERSMVGLSRLLERTDGINGQPLTPQQLPSSDFYVVFYESRDCLAECQAVREAVDGWLDRRTGVVSLLIVTLD